MAWLQQLLWCCCTWAGPDLASLQLQGPNHQVTIVVSKQADGFSTRFTSLGLIPVDPTRFGPLASLEKIKTHAQAVQGMEFLIYPLHSSFWQGMRHDT